MAKVKKEFINKLASWIDDCIPLKGILEGVDGFAIKLGLNYLNNSFGNNIPDELNDDIEVLITGLVNEDWDTVEKTVANVMAELINTPLIDGTDEELAAYTLIVTAISTFIQGLINKNK